MSGEGILLLAASALLAGAGAFLLGEWLCNRRGRRGR